MSLMVCTCWWIFSLSVALRRPGTTFIFNYFFPRGTETCVSPRERPKPSSLALRTRRPGRSAGRVAAQGSSGCRSPACPEPPLSWEPGDAHLGAEPDSSHSEARLLSARAAAPQPPLPKAPGPRLSHLQGGRLRRGAPVPPRVPDLQQEAPHRPSRAGSRRRRACAERPVPAAPSRGRAPGSRSAGGSRRRRGSAGRAQPLPAPRTSGGAAQLAWCWRQLAAPALHGGSPSGAAMEMLLPPV